MSISDEQLRASLRRQKFNNHAPVRWFDTSRYDSKLARVPLGECRPYAQRMSATTERPQILPSPTRN